MDKLSFFILNVFLNSLLMFFTVVVLIEALIFLFRIRQGRIASFLRMIPIFKLPFDLCLYDFSRWSYIKGINPLCSEEGTRTLSIMLRCANQATESFFLHPFAIIQLTLPENVTFTIADMLGYSIESKNVKVFTLFLIITSTLLFVRKLVKYFQSQKTLNLLTNTSQPLNRKIKNKTLIFFLKKWRLDIMTSSTLTGSPFIAGFTSYKIYFPQQLLNTLSRKEYEAILAHEIEHVHHKDGFVRFALDIIESIFWWVPTHWLHKRIEEGQEIECDLKCKKYGIDSSDLASAIFKSIRHTINASNSLLAHHLTKNCIHNRLNILLKPKVIRFQKLRYFCSLLVIGVSLLVIFVGRFWIF